MDGSGRGFLEGDVGEQRGGKGQFGGIKAVFRGGHRSRVGRKRGAVPPGVAVAQAQGVAVGAAVAGGAVVAGGRWRERLRQALGFVVVCQRVITGDEGMAAHVAAVKGGVGGEEGGEEKKVWAHGGFGAARGFT